MGTRHDYSQKALLKSRRAKRKVRSGAGWTKKRAAAAEAILNGATRAEAAKAAGFSERALRGALRDPVFLRRYRAEADLRRILDLPRSVLVLTSIRDDAELLKTAAGCAVIIKACRALEIGQGSTQGDIKIGLNDLGPGIIIAGRPILPQIAQTLSAEAAEAKRGFHERLS